MNEPLLATSNVIEIKPDKKYILVFRGGFTEMQIRELHERLKAQGIQNFIIALKSGDEVDVIEIPDEEC